MKTFAVIGCVFFLIFMVAPVMAEESGHSEGWEDGSAVVDTAVDGITLRGRVWRVEVRGNRTILRFLSGYWMAGTGNPFAAVYTAIGATSLASGFWVYSNYIGGVFRGPLLSR